jgi:hypothetical protein
MQATVMAEHGSVTVTAIAFMLAAILSNYLIRHNDCRLQGAGGERSPLRVSCRELLRFD